MAIFDSDSNDIIYVVRTDPHELLGTYSKHGFDLDGYDWPSVEHYVQAMKFEPDNANFKRIRNATHPEYARRIGEARLKRRKGDWKTHRIAYMTRAFFTKCHHYPEVAEALLATGEKPIREQSQYDYFWGCGRDGRGENHFGRVLIDIREKLISRKGAPALTLE